jgi:hypothetical protein
VNVESTRWFCPARAPAPILEPRAEQETDPLLTAVAGKRRSFADGFSNQQVDLVDVVDVFPINA